MVRSVEARIGAASETEVAARARLLLVGDFSASQVGNASVVEQFAARLEQAGDVVIKTSSSAHRVLRFADMVTTSFLARNRVDAAVIDVYSGSAFRWAEIVTSLMKSAGVPLIHVLRGGNLPTFAKSNGARVARLLASSDAAVALSGFLYDELSDYGVIAEVIPNPIDVAAYRFRQRHRASPQIVWLRGFNKIYNPALAPRMLHELRPLLQPSGGLDGHAAPHLTMIGADTGDGSKDETAATVERLGLQEAVTLGGPIAKPEVPARLAEYDIFINTTDVDNVPISVIEALATGLCVVSTDVGGIPYLLQDGVDSLLVPPDEPRAMAAAVERIVGDPSLAERLSRNGRAKAETFDWSRVMPQWRKLIGRVAGRGSAKP